MLSWELRNEINGLYAQLETKRNELLTMLTQEGFDATAGWFNNHYQKDPGGKWVREAFPIPVIAVNGLCDIEISFDGVSVTTKLGKKDAITYPYEEILEYEFEAYGVGEYLGDFYHTGQSVQGLKDAIEASNEKEIGFSFVFPLTAEETEIADLIRTLRCQRFFY